jgi:hypothetical protein
LNRIVFAYLDLAENQAERGILMKMTDWAAFLKYTSDFDREIKRLEGKKP